MAVKIFTGDSRDRLGEMLPESVHCVVTSPPYFGLRDYGVSGQIGLEASLDEYVSALVNVFREVWRVLRSDGTLWLNLGDSYAGSWGGQSRGAGYADTGKSKLSATQIAEHPQGQTRTGSLTKTPGLKPKDLCGIPWRVARALQEPYYTGRIKSEIDRVWLAAMLDAEGCLFIHRRKAGQHNGQGYYRQSDSYGPGVEIANTSRAVVERVLQLVGKGSICTQGPEETGGKRKQTIYRWNLRTIECRDFVREVYPYLVAKRQQARLLIGCPSSGERAEAAHQGLISLHRTGISDVDFPEPPSMFEQGWWLRQDLIWAKLNPMPESVTDRCTKSHEYLFLLAKSARYYFDAAAIAEPSSTMDPRRPYTSQGAWAMDGRPIEQRHGGKPRTAGNKTHKYVDAYEASDTEEHRTKAGLMKISDVPWEKRNRRSVWKIPSAPYGGAHFATFPPALVEPCILAGCPSGGVVLDPFGGAGTVAMVAERLGRDSILVELNSDYVAMAERRILSDSGAMFTEVEHITKGEVE